MTRIRGHEGEMDFCDLQTLANVTGRKVFWARARCEHGKTPDQTCRSCENGYVDDTSVYANLHGNVTHVAVLDDGSEVAYLKAGR